MGRGGDYRMKFYRASAVLILFFAALQVYAFWDRVGPKFYFGDWPWQMALFYISTVILVVVAFAQMIVAEGEGG